MIHWNSEDCQSKSERIIAGNETRRHLSNIAIGTGIPVTAAAEKLLGNTSDYENIRACGIKAISQQCTDPRPRLWCQLFALVGAQKMAARILPDSAATAD